MSWSFLSKEMLDSEASMVYSSAYGGNIANMNSFTISSSRSQGFCWNQDLFASQYQQMCKVVYDGHEDTIEGLIESLKDNYNKIKNEKARQQGFFGNRKHATCNSHRFTGECSDDEQEDGDQDMNYEDEDEALTDCEEEVSSRIQNRGSFASRSNSGYSMHPIILERFNRPRRISERSMSFVSDSKHGTYDRSECADIDVEEDTAENRHLKWLVSS